MIKALLQNKRTLYKGGMKERRGEKRGGEGRKEREGKGGKKRRGESLYY